MKPFEIIGAPLTLWIAPEGTAFPTLLTAPPGAWTQIGTSGSSSYGDDGVGVRHTQTTETATPAGSTAPVKAWRTAEGLSIGVTLWDLTLEQYLMALNQATVATTAAGSGTPGFKRMGLSQGSAVATYALLARGISAYGDGWVAQYEVPRCYQSGNPSPVFNKGKPAGLALEFTALADLAAASEAERFGRLLMQHAAPI